MTEVLEGVFLLIKINGKKQNAGENDLLFIVHCTICNTSNYIMLSVIPSLIYKCRM